MSEQGILEIAELDFALDTYDWPFARERAAEIADHWRKRCAQKPALFDGRALLQFRHEIFRATNGLALRGAYFETAFSNFLAWREFGFPGEPISNCFSMAALKSSDGAFLLGEMAPHTSAAGLIYFAAGTPDPSDVFDGKVDLTASVTRELEEETGISAKETTFEDRWIVVHSPPRIACMKVMLLAETAEAAKARIEAFLASEKNPELARMHIARSIKDIDEIRMPGFIQAFLRHAL
jgi:8-oxo-dGTP pyrophosphatase MutT (NUDIX family)